MKNYLQTALILMTLLCMNKISAQTGLGLRGSLAIIDQNVEVEDLELGVDSRLGIEAGLFYNHEIGAGFYIQPELNYSERGFKVEYLSILKTKASINYLRIPVLIKYDLLANNDQLFITPFVGPYLGFNLNSDFEEIEFVLNQIGIDPNQFITDTDIGLDMGFSIGIASGFFFDARYSLGLKNIFDSPAFDIGRITNRSITLGLGYVFPLGRS